MPNKKGFMCVHLQNYMDDDSGYEDGNGKGREF